MNCPRCSAKLQQVEILDETYVQTCPKCSGAFYTESELAVPLELADAKPGKWPCPSCGSSMETGTVCGGKIELDRCTDCGGFWFDAGELQTLSKLTGVAQLAKHVDAVGDFEEEDESEKAPHADPDSWWHRAVRFLLTPADPNKPPVN